MKKRKIIINEGCITEYEDIQKYTVKLMHYMSQSRDLEL